MINSVHILQSGYGVKLQTLHQVFAIQYTKCIKMPDTLENGTKLIHNHHMKDRNRNNNKRTVISYPSKIMELSQPLDGQSLQQIHLLEQNKLMLSLISLPIDHRLKYPLKLSCLLQKQKLKVNNYYGML